MPIFRIPGAAGSADIQTLIEIADARKDLAPKCHIGTGADLPGRTAPEAIRRKEIRAETDRTIAAAEPPIELEIALRLGGELRGQDETRDGHELGLVERDRQALEPARVELDVVIRVGDDLARREARPGVPSDVEPRPVL